MIRAVKLSIKYATADKGQQVAALLQRQASCINDYLGEIWKHGGSLNKETYGRVTDARLSARYRSAALNQALGIVAATKAAIRATGNKSSTPNFSGYCHLDDKVAKIQKSNTGGFDYWLKLSTLKKGEPILLPLKGTKVLNEWLSQPGATLKPSCALSPTHVVFYVNIPDLPKKNGRVLAFDVGINKMLVDSDGKSYGLEFKEKIQAIRNRKKGSKNIKQARVERDNYIRKVINEINWAELSDVVVEDLKHLKKGKKPNRNKTFRKAMAPWTYAYVLSQISKKAQENRVSLHSICPAYTSQTCPKCKHVARDNRANEKFKCVRCGFAADADLVGARNILARFTGSLESPVLATAPAES